MAKFNTSVQCKASPKEVFDFLSAGARTKLKVKSSDSGAMKVSLKNKMGLLSYGEIVDCTVSRTDMGSKVDLEGRPVLVTNVTADVKGAVMKVQEALVAEFGSR